MFFTIQDEHWIPAEVSQQATGIANSKTRDRQVRAIRVDPTSHYRRHGQGHQLLRRHPSQLRFAHPLALAKQRLVLLPGPQPCWSSSCYLLFSRHPTVRDQTKAFTRCSESASQNSARTSRNRLLEHPFEPLLLTPLGHQTGPAWKYQAGPIFVARKISG
jgi:hypothetical protein